MLPCISCKKEITPGEAKVFSKVLLCADCAAVANILYNRGRAELQQYLLLLEDMIRTSAIAGTLQLKMRDDSPDVMGSLVDMKEKMACGDPVELKDGIGDACSTERTSPSVQTLAVLGQHGFKQSTPAGTE